MKALEIFEKVNLVAPMEQRRFFNYLNDTIRELMGMFTDCLFDEKTKPVNDKVMKGVYYAVKNSALTSDVPDDVINANITYAIKDEHLGFVITQVLAYKDITAEQAKYVLREKFLISDGKLPDEELTDEEAVPVTDEVMDAIILAINSEAIKKEMPADVIKEYATYTINEDYLDFVIMSVVTYPEITLAQAKYVLKEKLHIDAEKLPSFIPLGKLSDELPVFPLYCNAIVDNILFLSGQDPSYKSEFLRKAENAHKSLWSDNAKGKFIKRLGW